MKKSCFLKGCLIAIFFCVLCAGGLYAWAVVSSWLPIDQAAPNLAPPGPVTQDLLELTPMSIPNAEEISTIQSSSKPDEVVALHQSMDDMDLLVVHESGLFHRWDLKTNALEAEYEFLAGRRTGVNFNADGSLVITPGKLVSEELLYGYSVWDVNTSEMLDCRGVHCSDNLREYDEQFADAGLALSPNGKWVVEYRGSFASGYPTHQNANSHGKIYVETDSFDGLWCKNKVDKKGEERVFLVYDKQEKNTLSPKRIIPCSELGCI